MNTFLDKIVTEIDKAASSTAFRLLPTVNYGSLITANAERVSFIPTGNAGNRLAIRSRLTRLKRNAIDIRVSAQQETSQGIINICQAHFTFITIPSKGLVPPGNSLDDTFTWVSSN